MALDCSSMAPVGHPDPAAACCGEQQAIPTLLAAMAHTTLANAAATAVGSGAEWMRAAGSLSDGAERPSCFPFGAVGIRKPSRSSTLTASPKARPPTIASSIGTSTSRSFLSGHALRSGGYMAAINKHDRQDQPNQSVHVFWEPRC